MINKQIPLNLNRDTIIYKRPINLIYKQEQNLKNSNHHHFRDKLIALDLTFFSNNTRENILQTIIILILDQRFLREIFS